MKTEKVKYINDANEVVEIDRPNHMHAGLATYTSVFNKEEGKHVLTAIPDEWVPVTKTVKAIKFNAKGEIIPGNDDAVHCGIPVKCQLYDLTFTVYERNPLYYEHVYAEDEDGNRLKTGFKEHKFLSEGVDKSLVTNDVVKEVKTFAYDSKGNRFQVFEIRPADLITAPPNQADARIITQMKENAALKDLVKELGVKLDAKTGEIDYDKLAESVASKIKPATEVKTELPIEAPKSKREQFLELLKDGDLMQAFKETFYAIDPDERQSPLTPVIKNENQNDNDKPV